MNENGLLGRSGERGLNALAKRSSPDSALEVRTIELIESIAANPLGSLFCCTVWRDCGGKRATGLSVSVPDGFVWVFGVGVGFVSGVGMVCRGRVLTPRNELNDETATSGDCGDRRLVVEPGISVRSCLRLISQFQFRLTIFTGQVSFAGLELQSLELVGEFPTADRRHRRCRAGGI